MNAADEKAILSQMLARLRRQDIAAAEKLLVDLEPHLRRLVRRQIAPDLQPKFDSIDVVQSVWVDLIEGLRGGQWQFEDVERLRAFLVRMTQNRFIDHARKHQRAARQEQPIADCPPSAQPADGEPAASEQVQAADTWEKLMMLCPPQHREILDLKRQGFSLAEIARRVGMHAGSVRRILYEVARRFALTDAGPDAGRRRPR